MWNIRKGRKGILPWMVAPSDRACKDRVKEGRTLKPIPNRTSTLVLARTIPGRVSRITAKAVATRAAPARPRACARCSRSASCC